MKKFLSYFIPVLMGFLTSVSLSASGIISQHCSFSRMFLDEVSGVSLNSVILVIALSILYYKTLPFCFKSACPVTHFLSICFSFFMLIGLSYSSLGNWDFIFYSIRQFIIAFIVFLGFFILFDTLLSALYHLLSTKQPLKKNIIKKFPALIEAYYFAFSFITIAVFWLPYLIFHLPGSVPYDGYRQINMFFGAEPLSNHHPWLLTLFFGFLFKTGRIISDNWSVFLITVTLFVINALCYAAVCARIKKWHAPFWFNISVLMFFSILPVFGAYSQVVMKDGIFSAFFTLFIAIYIDLCLAYYQNKSRKALLEDFVSLFIMELLVSLTRNNGFLMVIIADIILFFFFTKKKYKYVFLLSFAVLLSYYGINSVLASALHVEPSSKKEMLSVPFQQTARYLKEYPTDITPSEEEAISKILDYDNLAEKYIPEISDHVKDTYKNNVTNRDLFNYFKAWGTMFLRHPGVYFQATFHNTYGYYYPFHNCDVLGAYQFYIQGPPLATGEFDIHYIVPERIRSIIDRYAQLWRQFPGLALLTNPGTYTWVLLILGGYLCFCRSYRRIMALIPAFLNIIVCILSPVNGYLRYAIPLIACTPVLLYWCLIHIPSTKEIPHNQS